MTPAAQGHLAMLAFSALIAGSFSLGGMAAQHIAPAALNIARFALAALVAGSLALSLGKLPRSAFAAPWRYLILGGLFGVYFVTMFEALKTVTPVSTAAVFTLTPLIAAVIGRLVLGQALGMRLAGTLALGGVGALWVIFRGDLDAFLRFEIGRGEWIYFAGCVAHAIYPTASRALNRGEPALAVNFGMLVAGFLLLVAYGWREVLATDWAHLPSVVWITIGYTSVFSGVSTFTLLQFASQRLPAGNVMAYTYLVPAWVVMWQLALGHAAPPLTMLIGVGLIVLALVLLLRTD